MVAIPEYAELRALSNFSFLRGASQPEELVERAKQLGYAALAVADECSMAGAVRAHVAAKEHGLELLLGSQFEVEVPPVEGPASGGPPSGDTHPVAPFVLTAIACNLNGYGNLCQFITRLRLAGVNYLVRSCCLTKKCYRPLLSAGTGICLPLDL